MADASLQASVPDLSESP